MGRLKQVAPRLASLRPRLGIAPANRDDERRQRNWWRRWYGTATWQALRWSCLVRDLFTCQSCGKVEADTSKLHGDHIIAHRGDRDLFFDPGNVQTLCEHCHNAIKQREESNAWR